MPSAPRIPLGFKLGYTAWMAVWAPLYLLHNGPANFLWFCDAANFLVALALWTESRLLASSQAAGVFLIQVVWCFDFFWRLLLGVHPLGATRYMFDPAEPLWLRALSLFHVAMPVVLLYLLARLGYDARGWRLQTAIAWGLLPLSFAYATPDNDLNWVLGPFDAVQTLMPPLAYLAACMVLYPLVLFWPSHRLIAWWHDRPARGGSEPQSETHVAR